MNDNANARPPVSPEEQPVQPAASDWPPAASGQPGAQQPYPTGPAYPYQPPAAPPEPGSGKALAALICGICAILFAGTVVIGIALGVVAIVLAVQYTKAFGKDGKALGGKVCGIAGVVLSVIMLVVYLVVGTLIFQAALDYADDASQRRAITAPEPSQQPDSDPQPRSDTPAPDAGPRSNRDSREPGAAHDDNVEAAKQAAVTELDKVKSPDETTLALIAREADKEFADDAGFSLTEIGIDPAEFATWLAEGMDYTVVDADVRLRATEGEVLVTAQAKSCKELVRGLVGQTSAYVSPERLDRGASAAPLDEATKTALADLVRAGMDRASAASTTFSVDLVKADGAWAVERGEFESIIDDVFDL